MSKTVSSRAKREILFVALVLALTIGVAPVFAEGELHVEARVNETEISTQQPLLYSITIAGPMQETPKVHLNSFEGFQVVSTGQSQHIQLGGSQPQQALTLNYTLAPVEPGEYTLGPVTVEYQGELYETQPIEVKVTPPSEEEQRRRRLKSAPQLKGGVIL